MRQIAPRSRVAGIRVGAHWSVLVMVVLFGWLLGAQAELRIAAAGPATSLAAGLIFGGRGRGRIMSRR